MNELSPQQIATLERLISGGFSIVAFPLYANAVGVRKGNYAALLNPVTGGGLQLFGEPCVLLPFVRPGVQTLLRLDGSAKVERVKKLIDEIWSIGVDPADAAPDYWFHVGNRFAADQEPRGYSKARHAVWRLRQRLAP